MPLRNALIILSPTTAKFISGQGRNALLYEVFTDEGAGTMITQ